MDLTGYFPYKSSGSYEHILIAYHIDVNAILGTPVKNWQTHALKKAWLHLHTQFN